MIRKAQIEDCEQVEKNHAAGSPDACGVDTMAVLEEHRGKGIGHALFEEMERIAKEKNFEGIELQVNAKNEKAMKMYKGYGFNEKSINMEMYF